MNSSDVTESWAALATVPVSKRRQDHHRDCINQPSVLKYGFGEQHCRKYCEQNKNQEETLRCSESEALPCQRPSAQRAYVGSQPLGESDRLISLWWSTLMPFDLPMFNVMLYVLFKQSALEIVAVDWQIGCDICQAVRFTVIGTVRLPASVLSSHRKSVATFAFWRPCSHRCNTMDDVSPSFLMFALKWVCARVCMSVAALLWLPVVHMKDKLLYATREQIFPCNSAYLCSPSFPLLNICLGPFLICWRECRLGRQRTYKYFWHPFI